MTNITILTAGEFGDRVALRLREQWPAATTAALAHERESLRPLIEAAQFVAVAAWRPYAATFRVIDELCFETRTPWSVAEIHGQRLTCGPLVRPEHGPCYGCYRMRWNSHHPAPQRELVLERAYARDPNLGPPGFIGPLVEIAAAALIEDVTATADKAGRLRLIDILTGAVLESEVIAVHGCARCQPVRDKLPGERFVRHLAPALQRVL